MKCDVRKVSIVGIGNVGVTAAYALLLRGLVDELVLVSRSKDKAYGEKLDLEHGLVFMERANIIATDDYKDIAGSDVVVVTAGVAQKPGQTRLDLAKANIAIIEEIIPEITKNAPDSVIVIVSNPVDVLTFKAIQIGGLPPGRIFGSGTMLDTARFRFHLSEKFKVNPRSIHAYILGEHGDSSFPTLAGATIGGQPLNTFPGYTPEIVQTAFQDVKNAAYQIIQAKGATYYAIGAVIMHLVNAITHDQQSVLPVSTLLNNYYGQSGVAASVPCIIGRNGVEQVLQVELSTEEQAQFAQSCATLKPFCI